MKTSEYTLDDITSDAAHLYALIDTVTDYAIDISPVDIASSELQARWVAGRLCALLWITRDLSEKIANGLDALPPMEPRARHGGATVGPDRGG